MGRKKLIKDLKRKDLLAEKIGSGYMITVEGQPSLENTVQEENKKDKYLRKKT